jgi:hypothetical protein
MSAFVSTCRSLFPLEAWRVAPEILQAVKGALVSMKHVDNYLQVIKHDPLAGRETVNRHRSNRVILSQSRFNFICDRFKLRLGSDRANHKEIGERRDRAQIQDDDVLRLFIRGEFGAGFC